MSFLRFRDLKPRCDAATIEAHLRLALQFKRGERADAPLAGKHAVLLFEKPSLRTKLSFEIAISKLGGNAIYFAPQEVDIGRRETPADAAATVSRLADLAIMRTFKQQTIDDFAANASIPVVNALSDAEHPCQALADLLTIYERFGEVRGRKVVYIGDGNNVAVSLAWAVASAGGEMVVIAPPGRAMPPDAVRQIAADIEQTEDIGAVAAADAVYTDAWVSMGAKDGGEAQRALFEPYRVTAALMRRAKQDAVFMHCLPAHEGEEVERGVLRSDWSACFEQAENRLWAQMAIIWGLLNDINEISEVNEK